MSDLDLPLLPSADQIRRRQFATVRRGYDPDQVTEYLSQIATQVEALENELREERLQVSGRAEAPPAPAPTPVAPPAPVSQPATAEDAYTQLSARLAKVLRTADEQAQQLVADAQAEAKKIMEEAQAEADAIRVDAQATAEEARAKSAAELERAREEADRVLGGLEQRREAMLVQMHDMQSKLLAVAQNLDVPDIDDAGPGGGAHAAGDRTAPAPPAPAAQTAEPEPPQVEETPDQPVAEAAPRPVGSAAAADGDPVDPRYEDLWASTETPSVDIPDLSSLDIDFDDEDRN